MFRLTIELGRRAKAKLTRKVAMYLSIIASLLAIVSFFINHFFGG